MFCEAGAGRGGGSRPVEVVAYMPNYATPLQLNVTTIWIIFFSVNMFYNFLGQSRTMMGDWSFLAPQGTFWPYSYYSTVYSVLLVYGGGQSRGVNPRFPRIFCT